VDAPRFNSGQGVQRLLLTFPSFAASLEYDPTSSFATSDAALNQELLGELAAPGSGTAAPAATAALLALLGAAVSMAAVAVLGDHWA
jgi:hypothetical protein